MKIHFNCFGIRFTADVTDTDDRLIINGLTGNGHESMWLLDSQLLEQIEQAACAEYQRIIKSSNDDSIIDRYITDQDWRMGGAI